MDAVSYTDDDDLSQGKGDPDMHGYPGEPRYIGIDKPRVVHSGDALADWLGHPSQQWELGDQMADHSDQQEYDPDD